MFWRCKPHCTSFILAMSVPIAYIFPCIYNVHIQRASTQDGSCSRWCFLLSSYSLALALPLITVNGAWSHTGWSGLAEVLSGPLCTRATCSHGWHKEALLGACNFGLREWLTLTLILILWNHNYYPLIYMLRSFMYMHLRRCLSWRHLWPELANTLPR